MVKGFIFGGVLTTAIMFSGLTFAASSINTDSLLGMGRVNIQKTIDSVSIGRLLKAEQENNEDLTYKIKNP